MDNSGYQFDKLNDWQVRELSFHKGIFNASEKNYLVMEHSDLDLLIFKRIGPRMDEHLVKWNRFCGFIFYNYVLIFTDNTLFVFEDNFEFSKSVYEYDFHMKRIDYNILFKCYPKSDYVETVEDDDLLPFSKYKLIIVLINKKKIVLFRSWQRADDDQWCDVTIVMRCGHIILHSS